MGATCPRGKKPPSEDKKERGEEKTAPDSERGGAGYVVGVVVGEPDLPYARGQSIPNKRGGVGRRLKRKKKPVQGEGKAGSHQQRYSSIRRAPMGGGGPGREERPV